MAEPCLNSFGSRAFQDPHLNFAHGGQADFRGRHNVLYNFLSAPGLSVNVKSQEVRSSQSTTGRSQSMAPS